MRLLVTRPENDSRTLAKTLNDLGHETVVEPLLSIRPVRDIDIPDRAYQALIITSANGARAIVGHAAASVLKSVPVLAVGLATAGVLGGFAKVDAGSRGTAELVAKIRKQLRPEQGPILYVRGHHVAANIVEDLAGSGFDVDEVILYEAMEIDVFSPATIDHFQRGVIEGVVLFSPRTATIFCQLIEKAHLGETLAEVKLICLSQNVADACIFSSDKIVVQRVVAENPTQESLIGLI